MANITRAVRISIYDKCEGKCHYCDEVLELDGVDTLFDQKKSKSKKGKIKNTVLVCESCSLEKANNFQTKKKYKCSIL